MSAPNNGTPAVSLPPPRRGFRPRNLAKGLAILMLGIFIGSAVTAHIGHHLMKKVMGDPDKMSERLHHRLDRQLDLTPEQSEKVGAIIKLHSDNFKNIMQETHPRLTEQFEQMHDEIRRELNPEQAAEWDEIAANMKRRFPPPFIPGHGEGPKTYR